MASPAKMKNKTVVAISISGERRAGSGELGVFYSTLHSLPFTRFSAIQKINDHNRQNHICQRERQKEFPAEIHQLVETETWQSSANPDIEKQKRADFSHEQYKAGKRVANRSDRKYITDKRCVPTAQKECRAHHRHGEHIDILSHEEEREFQRGIFRVKSEIGR